MKNIFDKIEVVYSGSKKPEAKKAIDERIKEKLILGLESRNKCKKI